MLCADGGFFPEKNVVVISNEYYERMKAERPELLRCYLDELYEQLDDDGFVTDEKGNVP